MADRLSRPNRRHVVVDMGRDEERMSRDTHDWNVAVNIVGNAAGPYTG
jgi:hypothetical protein